MTPASRRVFLRRGAVLLGVGGLALVAGSEVLSERPAAPVGVRLDTAAGGTPGTLAAVLAEASSTAGRRLLGSPWETWAGAVTTGWSGLYVSWLLRHLGGTPTTDVAAVRNALAARGRTGTAPAVGAVVFYSPGSTAPPTRAGLVTSVTRGVAQTVEGDHPVTVPLSERFVRRLSRPGHGTVSYGYPEYM
ncbi:CHAP domain-containing protein [Geodermatophilus sp. FMUSA9-8]|uniref:CHAP domain-containing protein n=1 Tax=Geodermatophilus sp. FMUSA9-8 TaxID=3120155 RepID=UPI00300AE0CF